MNESRFDANPRVDGAGPGRHACSAHCHCCHPLTSSLPLQLPLQHHSVTCCHRHVRHVKIMPAYTCPCMLAVLHDASCGISLSTCAVHAALLQCGLWRAHRHLWGRAQLHCRPAAHMKVCVALRPLRTGRYYFTQHMMMLSHVCYFGWLHAAHEHATSARGCMQLHLWPCTRGCMQLHPCLHHQPME